MVEKRRQSPSYPAIDIKEAIDLVQKIHGTDRNFPIDREVAAKHMGFAGLTGRSMSVLASLLQYELLDKLPDSQVKVSDTAVKILHPQTDSERAEAIRKAAMSPTLFSELNSRFDGHVPSNENLRSHLIRVGFLDRPIPSVIRSFTGTMDYLASISPHFAELEESSTVADQDADVGDIIPAVPREPSAPSLSRNERPVHEPPSEGTLREDIFTVDEGSIRVVWPKRLSSESFEDVSDWFEILLRKMKRMSM